MQYDVSDNISPGTSVKLPISLISIALAGVLSFGWAEFEQHREIDQKRFEDASERINRKVFELREYVDKKSSDRYTAVEARQREKSVEQRFSDAEKRNDAQHVGLQRQIDNISSTCVKK